MHVLFVHRAFPAQFGRIGYELRRRHGWKCTYIIGHLSRCPSPSEEMLKDLELIQLPAPSDGGGANPPWPQAFGQAMAWGRQVFEAVRCRPTLRPDLVVGHGGLMPTLFLREILDCPFVDYCEYYFAPNHRDLTYRVDLPSAEPAPFFPRCINAATLLSLVECDAAYAPTDWQRLTFPSRFHSKIEVHFDGIDTNVYQPGSRARTFAGHAIPADTRVVTYVARGLEAIRGFDLFMDIARDIAARRPDVLFVVVGEEYTHYGWDLLQTGKASFKQWTLARGAFDPSRFLFLGHLEPAELANLLCVSDLHLYLTVPFVCSWSLFNALACGCIVIAADVPPVREIVHHGQTGLLAPLFDRERWVALALDVLDNRERFRNLGLAGRRLIEAKCSLDVAAEGLMNFYERVATGRAANTASSKVG